MSNYASVVMWALGVRDSDRPGPSAATLARAVTPDLVGRAAATPVIRRRLDGAVPEDRHHAAVRALNVIVSARHLRHDFRTSLGASLARLNSSSSSSTAASLGLIPASTQPNATRLLGNALSQAGRHGTVNLVEFVTLLTDWDDLDLRSRSAFLVDFHAACRA